MSLPTRTFLKQQMTDKKGQLPKKITRHEKSTWILLFLSLCLHCMRWNEWFGGWSDNDLLNSKLTTDQQKIPAVKDATSAAIIAVTAHILPSNWHFLKYCTAKKRRDLPALKAESTILWWKFVDKNINYGYFFVMGAGGCLVKSAQVSGLNKILADNLGANITNLPWNAAIFIVVLVAVIFGNAMSGIAACVTVLPFVLGMGTTTTKPWLTRLHLAGLAVGMGSSYGLLYPFIYTTAYFCHYVGKVPILTMMKYSIGSVIICLIVVYLAVVFYAPVLWVEIPVPPEPTTSEAPPAPPPP